MTLTRARRILCVAAVVLAGVPAGALAPVAHPAAADDGALAERRREVGDRLVIAGRQRMLAQGMAASLCLADAGVAPEGSRGRLYVMWSIFGWYHSAMLSGNRVLELAPETDAGVRTAWLELDAAWTPLGDLYETVLDGAAPDDAAFDRAMALTAEVTDRATDVVTALRSAYSGDLGPRGMGAALLIDLYERQRMLGKMIEKDVCLISRGDASEERGAGLARTLGIFALSLEAFRNGRADVGVPVPPTPGIAAALALAQESWDTVAAFADATAGGRTPEQAELVAFAAAMNRFGSAMTAAINGLVSFQGQQPG